MREEKFHIYLNDDEYSRVIQSLIRLKNSLIAQGRYGKYIVQNFAVRAYDKAVMLVLCYIDSDINHNNTSQCVYLMLNESTGHFTSCNLVLN